MLKIYFLAGLFFSRPKAGFYIGPALSCPSAMMCVPDSETAKLRLGKVKSDTVPLSFIKNHKYHSKRMREGHTYARGARSHSPVSSENDFEKS